MGECRGCQWWDRAEAIASIGFPMLHVDVGQCCRANRDDAPMMILASAVRIDSAGQVQTRTALLTVPDFGCSQFAPREGTVSDGSPN